MRLYLSQHGLAKEKTEDPERPLSDQGREDVARVAGFLSLFEKPRPARIVHSGKPRARQTAEMFAEGWGHLPVEESSHLEPNDDPAHWIDLFASMGEELMLVGHLPHIQRLAGLLICGDKEALPVRFRNGGVVCLERSEHGWSVCWQVNPTLFYGED
jgi:phosphohistidine phosphatase